MYGINVCGFFCVFFLCFFCLFFYLKAFPQDQATFEDFIHLQAPKLYLSAA